MKLWQVVSFAEPDQLLGIARAAEEAGLHGVLLSDHLFFPGRLRSRYPYSEDGKPAFDGATPFPDPWTTIAAMAAVTERLRFATMVYILPLRHPLEVAKTVGTAALLSGGRVALGVGAGWIREEFDALGVPFAGRGARMDEMIEVLRKLWSGEMVEHHGRFYEFPRLQMSPGVPQRIPIYSGGVSEAAFRRVGRLSDGWISDLHTADELLRIAAELRARRAEHGREREPLDIVAACSDTFDADGYRRLADGGVTHLLSMPWVLYGGAAAPSDKRDGLRRFADDVISKLR
jgi:probable F420-dependent oxidoreductase